MKKKNQIELIGENVKKLKVKLSPLEEKYRLNDSLKMMENYFFYNENSENCFYKKKFNYNKIQQLDNFKIKNKDDLNKKIDLYVSCLNQLTTNEKENISIVMKEKMRKAMTYFPENFNYSNFFDALNRIPFVNFYLIIEEQNEKFIAKISNTIIELGF